MGASSFFRTPAVTVPAAFGFGSIRSPRSRRMGRSWFALYGS